MSRERVILPGSTIGILGGGQLGLMLALQARAMGYQVACLDPDPCCPCHAVSDYFFTAPYDSLEGAKALAEVSDVITYEFENIGAELARILERDSYLPQGYELLFRTKNRIREKEALLLAGAPITRYRIVSDEISLHKALAEIGFPAVLKTAEGGYDGKGQWVLRTSTDLYSAIEAIETGRHYVLEEFVPFAKEISVIVVRNPQGEIRMFPAVENIHRNNILHMTIAPGRLTTQASAKASEIALKIAKHFKLVGLLAIEMFLLSKDELLVNELAPRPHNSGHYTQQACPSSQFEQHIRAICNLPLADSLIYHPTVMVNILGENLPLLMERYAVLPPAWQVHLYGKKDIRVGRKMGHVNISAPDVSAAIHSIAVSGIWPQ